MKYTFFILMLFALIGCSKSDCDEPNLIGETFYSEDPQLAGWTYEFAKKEFKTYSQGIEQSSIKYKFDCDNICFDGLCGLYEYNNDTLFFHSSSLTLLKK